MSSFIYESTAISANYLDNISDFELKLKFDSVTYQHSLNVARLSLKLSKLSSYDLDDVLVYYAGLFHDVGKSLVPITVLNKDKQLTREEFAQIKEHAKQGFRILQKYKFPSDILFAALLHHERFDGSGYPIGFVGKEIPVVARIINICDVFDALTSDRPYRNAYSYSDALRIMENTREQFDPELLGILFKEFQNQM